VKKIGARKACHEFHENSRRMTRFIYGDFVGIFAVTVTRGMTTGEQQKFA